MISFVIGMMAGGAVTALFMACFRLAGREDSETD